MKEPPILFSGEMVRATLDGRKTVTRRVVKPQPEFGVHPCHWNDSGMAYANHDGACTCHGIRSPYGQPGDRLWVRETWAAGRDDSPVEVLGPPSKMNPDKTAIYFAAAPLAQKFFKWRPSIHMPRWASRITLEVTGVRVERVQEITEEQAIAEGVDAVSMEAVPRQATMSRRADFKQLWDKLNAKRGFGWDKNPLVWVVEFKRVVP